MVFFSAMRAAPARRVASPLSSTIYNTMFRRSATFAAAIFGAALVFEMAWDTALDSAWDYMNKGRQWKDIRVKYITSGDEA